MLQALIGIAHMSPVFRSLLALRAVNAMDVLGVEQRYHRLPDQEKTLYPIAVQHKEQSLINFPSSN